MRNKYMSDVELVIKIPEEKLSIIKNKMYCGIYDSDLYKAIANGTILPKGHGKLIDADAFERRCMFDSDIEDMQDVIYALRDYKSIIEADKEQEE